MSKIYKKYLELKSSSNYNDKTLFLFKSGIFFIFIDKDAEIIAPYLNLKIGQLNESIVKCGFPTNSLQKYLNILKNTPYQVEIVSLEDEKTYNQYNYILNENIKKIIDEIININIDNLSISQAYDFLYYIQKELKN